MNRGFAAILALMFSAPLGNRYAIRSELDAGGNGRVYLAEDLKLGRPVAVKVVAPTPVASLEERIRRLEREAHIAATITHPNVCAVSDKGTLDDGRPYLVMELLAGESLLSRLERDNALPVGIAMDLGHQMLGALDAAHRRGVIHRDVKPENFFLVPLGAGRHLLKLLDFGTAQVVGMSSPHGDELTKIGLVIGTMPYMSPEQIRGMRDFDTRTDVYSAAVVLYEMLCGTRPFGDLPPDQVAESIAFKQPPSIARRLPTLARGIVHAIDSALAVDRKRRPADAAAFLRLLEAPATPSVAPVETSLIAAVGAPKAPEKDHDSAGEWEVATRQMDGPNRGADEWDVRTIESGPAETEAQPGTLGVNRSPSRDRKEP